MGFIHVPDDVTKYIYLYPPPDIAAMGRSQAKRVLRQDPQFNEQFSEERQRLMSQGWTETRYAKTVYSPDSTKDEIITKTVYSREQLDEALEDGWLSEVPKGLHPHDGDRHRQAYLAKLKNPKPSAHKSKREAVAS